MEIALVSTALFILLNNEGYRYAALTTVFELLLRHRTGFLCGPECRRRCRDASRSAGGAMKSDMERIKAA